MSAKKLYTLYTDGGARGNPGPAAIGGVIDDEQGKEIAHFAEYIGHTTNNVAEYRSLLFGLTLAQRHSIGRLRCFLDSELLVKQLNYEYKVKNKDLAILFAAVHELRSLFEFISFNHVPREKNKRADAQVNKAFDEHSS